MISQRVGNKLRNGGKLPLAAVGISAIAVLVLFGIVNVPRVRGQSPAPSQPGRGGVGYPRCLDCPKPPYPKNANTSNAQTVILKAIIDTGGHATNIEVVKSAGEDFDKNAIETVRKWHFAAAKDSDGNRVPVITPIEVTFPSMASPTH